MDKQKEKRREEAMAKELIDLRKKVKEFELEGSSRKMKESNEMDGRDSREADDESDTLVAQEVEGKENVESKKRKRGGTRKAERDAV